MIDHWLPTISLLRRISIASIDKRWRHVRRIITPAFTAHKVSQSAVANSIGISIKGVFGALRTASNDHITVSLKEADHFSDRLKVTFLIRAEKVS